MNCKIFVLLFTVFVIVANLKADFLEGSQKPYDSWTEGKTANYSYAINNAGELKVKIKEHSFSIMPIGIYPPHGKSLYNALESIKGKKAENNYEFKGEFSGIFFFFTYSLLPDKIVFDCRAEAVSPPQKTWMVKSSLSFYGRDIAKNLNVEYEFEGKNISQRLDMKNKYFRNIQSSVLKNFDGFDIKIDQSKNENWKKTTWEFGIVKGKPQYKNVINASFAGTPSRITQAGDLAHIKLIISLTSNAN